MIEAQQDRLTADRLFLRRMVQSSAAIVALLVALVLPLGYAVIGYQYEAADARSKAEDSARRVAGYIFQHPNLWEYNSVRLSEIVGSNEIDVKHDIRLRIVKADGKVVVSRGTTEARLTTVQSAPIIVGDATLAELELQASLDPLMRRVCFSAFASCCLGFLVYFAFRKLPLYALDNALGELERLQDRIIHKNEELTRQNDVLMQQEDALKRRSGQLVNAQRLGKIGDWSYRLGDTDLWWAPEIFRLLGYDPASFHTSREAVLSTYAGDGARRVVESQADVVRKGVSGNVDVKVKCGDGSIRDVTVTSEAWTLRAAPSASSAPFRIFPNASAHRSNWRSLPITIRSRVWLTAPCFSAKSTMYLPAAAGPAPGGRCCCSILTGSRRSTTRSGTPGAMSC